MPGQVKKPLLSSPFGAPSFLDPSTANQSVSSVQNGPNAQDVGRPGAAVVDPANNTAADTSSPLSMWGDAPTDLQTADSSSGGAATATATLPSGRTFPGCQTLASIDAMMVPAVTSSQNPNQMATDAAHAEVAVSADPLRQQTDALQTSVRDDAAQAAAAAAAEVARLEAAMQDPNGNGQVIAVDGAGGIKTYLEVTEDAQGRQITHRVQVNPITGETTTETLTHDPNNQDAPFTYEKECVSVNGDDAKLERRESTFEVNPGSLGFNPDGDSGFDATTGAKTFSSISAGADSHGANIQTQSIQYDEWGVVVGGNESSMRVRRDSINNIGAPGDTEGVFDPNQDVYSVETSNSVLGENGRTVRTSELGQGQTMVSSLDSGDGTPTSIIVQKQTDDNTRVTQQFVEGSPQSVVTKTTVSGNQVTERTEVWNKPDGFPAEMTGTTDTTRLYGDDGKLAQQDQRSVDLKSGELTETRTTREVDGNEVVYNTSTYHEERGQESSLTYGQQTAELGPDGAESVRSTQLNTPDGQSLTVNTQDGQAPTATLTNQAGSTVTGRVEPGSDGGTVISLIDNSTQPPSNRQIHINADGSLAEDANLSDAEKSLVPTLLAVGKTVASNGSSGLGMLAGLRDPAQAATLPATLTALGIDPKGFNPLQMGSDGLGLLGGIFSMGSAISELNTPGNNNVRTLFDLAGSTVDASSSLAALGADVGMALGGSELAAVKMLGQASTFLGGVSGFIGAGAGVYDFVNAKDRYDQADGALAVATGVGGMGIAGATLLGATPPGWVAAAIIGLGLVGNAIVDEARSHYLPPVYQDLLDPSQQQTPEYQ